MDAESGTLFEAKKLRHARDEFLQRYPALRRELWNQPSQNFIDVSEAVHYFESQKIADLRNGISDEDAGKFVQCILTGGPDRVVRKGHKKNKSTRTAFRRVGANVHTGGEWGRRIITLRAFSDRYIRR